MPISDYTPSLDQVGAIALSRTVDDVGNVTGTFNTQTRPTDTSVNMLITKALDDVAPEIGADIPADLQDKAKNVVAIRTAMLIELTLYGIEIRNNLSPYPELKALYEEELAKLKTEVAVEEGGGDPTNELGGNYPAWGFPEPDNLLFGEM